MNGPNSMYTMRPIIRWSEEIELPDCMYKMKVIQDSGPIFRNERKPDTAWSTIISEQKPLPEVAALETRQEAILAQLAELKNQLTTLREELKKPPSQNTFSNVKTVLTATTVSLKDRLSEEIVINANPERPPYSLLAYNNLSQNCLNICSHVHSGVSYVPCDLLNQFSKTPVSLPLLNIRLIWKNVSDTELLANPTKHTVIRGEINVLRFLSHIGPTCLDYESTDPLTASVADGILDTCYKLINEKSTKARQTLVKSLGTHLKKSQYLLGSSISIADIAAWSIIKQIGLTSKELSPNIVNTWFECCNQKMTI